MPDLTIPQLIRTRGHWEVSIQPATFELRIRPAELEATIESNVVRLRGWPVPFVGGRHEWKRRGDHVGQDIDARDLGHLEAWRFFRSGQFSQLRSFGLEWEAKVSSTRPADPHVMPVWEILFYLTELFELAARLSLSPAGDRTMTVNASLNNVKGRRLVSGDPSRVGFDGDYVATESSIKLSFTGTRAELASPRELAVALSQDALSYFGWNAPAAQLVDFQTELTQPRS